MTRKSSGFPWLFLAAGAPIGLIILTLIVFRFTGQVRPFKVPTDGMKPALQHGDQFFMDGVTYMFRGPRRHEILVFSTAGIAEVQGTDDTGSAPIYVKRVAGVPGDHLQIRDGELYVNGEKDRFYEGQTFTISRPMRYLESSETEVAVPADSYFVIGDNIRNSFDSRFWGYVPAKNVRGRALVRYWPPARIGFP